MPLRCSPCSAWAAAGRAAAAEQRAGSWIWNSEQCQPAGSLTAHTSALAEPGEEEDEAPLELLWLFKLQTELPMQCTALCASFDIVM